MMKIDAVITWVDGDDPSHKTKRARYGSSEMFKADDVAGSTRFSSLGEIFWCVASLHRFAPWLNRIYIVTDEQDPGLEPFLNENFPDDRIPVEVVDHKTIFRGYEEYLPTFNSVSIETMTWRIPGLSEHYLELNDDMMLACPSLPSDFFAEDGRPVCYAVKYSRLWTSLTRRLKPKRNGKRKVTFKGLMMNAADLVCRHRYFLKIDHTPRALLKSFYEQWFSSHPDTLVRNIRCRFREADQFNPQVLQAQYLHLNGLNKVEPVKGNLFFFQSKSDGAYFEKKMRKLENSAVKFVCLNSLDQASHQERKCLESWIGKTLGLVLNKR